jgi:hypothetical protein
MNSARRILFSAVLTLAVAAPAEAHATPDETSHEPAAAPPSADGSVVWHWNQTAMDVLTQSGRPLLTQPFVVAAMHVAMYDAVVAIEGRGEPRFTKVTARPGASATAAVATAAHRVLVGFLPANAATFDTALAEQLAAIADGPARTDGMAAGETAGWGTLSARLSDGSQAGPVPPLPTPGTGVWEPTPPATAGLNPWIAIASPYAMRRPDQFRTDPPALDSKRYQRDLDEVRRLGGTTSTERTAEQTTIARFWADQPVAQNQRTLRRYAMDRNGDLFATARLFAAVLTSEADAFIACWDAKFTYLRWRPWQSVPAVEPGWTPLLGTPNHPEFPSAHGCLTGALAFSLATVTGTDQINVDIDATTTGTTRHYATVEQLTTEVGNARIWGGIHLRHSVEAGLLIAKRVTHFNLHRHFKLKH